ncbi:MAG: hypothetical protein CVU05_13605 [Bacteroidetes bacterium HGW-Bacteroidetes-21]|jgi:gliding motility-associated-like protein|nr:MAG: hypothetical protein CVU05_13605 [Bacteroidetes bacterium HGW-Bacteroidetes-21]
MKILFKIFIILLLTNLTVKSQVISYFSADTNFYCINNPVQFTDTSVGIGGNITDWLWDFGDGTTSTDQHPEHAYSVTGTYDVSLTVSYATWSNTLIKPDYITVRQIPDADFTFKDSIDYPFFMIFFNGVVNNNDGINYTFSWDFPGSVSYQDTTDSLFHVFNTEGTHNVTFYVTSGQNCSDTVSKTVIIKDLLEVPNVFSPNGDGINDVFTFRTNGITTYELTIFNRWGAELYKVTAKRIFWDGHTAAGVLMPPGNYYYRLVSVTDPPYEKAGVVVLR